VAVVVASMTALAAIAATMATTRRLLRMWSMNTR
jgi:hypothetical protein